MIEFWNVFGEILKGLGYSLLGFFAGYQVCKFRRSVERIEEAVVSDHEKHEISDKGGVGGTGGPGGIGGVGGVGTPDGTGGTGGQGGPGGTGGSYSESASGSGWQGRALGIIVLILTVFTVASNIHTNNETRRNAEHDKLVTECQAKFNEEFSIVLQKRAQYAEQDRATELAMWRALLVGATPEERRKVFEDYLNAATRTDELRRQNPLPNLAARNCGEVS